MTPQVDQMRGGTTQHSLRPEGNVVEMRHNAKVIRGHAAHLRDQEGRSAKETRITGSGPLVERINQREAVRTPAIKAQVERLEDAAKALDTAANQVEEAQGAWEKNEKARSKGK